MKRPQVSLRWILGLIFVAGILLAHGSTLRRLRYAENELSRLRTEVGYLEPDESKPVAALRLAVDEPLLWQARVRIPPRERYRVAYSAVWRKGAGKPDWFAAQPLPAGESIVTVRVMRDPRDDKWRISTIIRHEGGVGRIGTVLPDEISAVFRGSHDVVSGGVGRQAIYQAIGTSVRLFDERYLSGAGMLLYGDKPPEGDLIGIFAELQPDIGPL